MDEEMRILGEVLTAIEPLEIPARERVIDYVCRRLNIQQQIPKQSAVTVSGQDELTSDLHDIRSLKDRVKPESGIQLVALVGYYLREIATDEDKRDEFGSSELSKCVVQAGARDMIKDALIALNNAKKAGYLDAGSGRGLFKLNAVGRSLILKRLRESKEK